jgi:glycine oxidase
MPKGQIRDLANYDTIIIGGGVIGLSLARELHCLGQRRIAVVERGRIGREASFAAAGMLAPNAENEVVDDFYRFCDESRAMFPQLAQELLAETGVDIELDRSGTLYAAFTEEDSEHLNLRFARQIEAVIPVEKLTAADSLNAEPYLAENVRESLYFPNDWQVENRKLLTALKQYASVNGIELVEGTQVDSVIVEGSTVEGIAVGGRRFFAATTVLATGAWTSLIKIGDVPVPFLVKPIRGQMISFGPARRFFKRVIYSPRGYLVPRADGRILAGATVEDIGFDSTTTDDAVEGLRISAAEIAPCLADLKIAENWAGLRPFAKDGLPILGLVGGYDNLFVATAHYRNGILLAPVTAKLLAERIVNGMGSKYIGLFGPDRLIKKGLNANA